MIRLIIFAILCYILYRVVKSLMLPPAGEPSRRPNGIITDEMVMDPQCNVYIPRKEAITAKVAGETIYFCSKECKKKYLEEQHHKN